MMPRTARFGCTTVASLLFLVAFSPAASGVTLAEALSAYRSNRAAAAEAMLAQVAADPAAPASDRAAALHELGRIDALVRGETDAIDAAMAQVGGGEESCLIAATALRAYRDTGDAAAPLNYAEAAASHCSLNAAETLRVERARTHLALSAADPAARQAHLTAAAAQLAGVSEIAGGAPGVASARLALAIAARDADAAFGAWRDYYWLTDADAPPALRRYAGRVEALFAAGLRENAADADVLAMLDLLTRAGFTADARRYAAERNLASRNADNAEWRRIESFFAFDAAVRAATLRANREIAAGGEAGWYEGEIRVAMGQLLQTNGLSGDPQAALAETFGIYGTLGETSGYPSLHGGHLVQDDTLQVEQYGRRGEMRFIVIDNMLANGYESWLWDGWAEAGGWSPDANTIVQVRSAYTDGPLQALRRARPGTERERFLETIERDAAEERRALGRDGVAELPAAENRLRLQAWDDIAARVGDDDDAFIAEVWRATNQYSIELHEGRHALDKASGRFSTPDLEYRAKLSQIIFADYPRLGLASVAGGAQNSTAHGRGNRRVLEGYRSWMRAHRDEIAGFDQGRPTLSQLHLLSDAQIVAAARSLDPWAR